MLLKDVSIVNNIFALFFTWVVLAGFLVLPATFKTLYKLPINSTEYKEVMSVIKHLHLKLAGGFACCAIGVSGMCILWRRQRANYSWLVSNIFVPGCLNGLAGLISTFVSIYAHNNGTYCTSSIATIAVTGGIAAICGFLAAFYSWWLVRRLKNEHEKRQRIIPRKSHFG